MPNNNKLHTLKSASFINIQAQKSCMMKFLGVLFLVAIVLFVCLPDVNGRLIRRTNVNGYTQYAYARQ